MNRIAARLSLIAAATALAATAFAAPRLEVVPTTFDFGWAPTTRRSRRSSPSATPARTWFR
ncbi:MAG: hypothetical protein JO102_06635 [Elusimicrobia bacterium]|nr:hypothetical protein [Elusimicrobiota bacterium]